MKHSNNLINKPFKPLHLVIKEVVEEGRDDEIEEEEHQKEGCNGTI